MDDFSSLIRANKTNAEWLGILIMGKLGKEAVDANEREYIINYLLSTNDIVIVRAMELLEWVEVQGDDLNVTIEQLKSLRLDIIHKMSRYYDDPMKDDTILKHGLYPITKEIRKYLKFWDKNELEHEVLVTETYAQTLKNLENEAFGSKKDEFSLKDLIDCQGEHVCKITPVDFRPNNQ